MEVRGRDLLGSKGHLRPRFTNRRADDPSTFQSLNDKDIMKSVSWKDQNNLEKETEGQEDIEKKKKE